MNCELSPLGPQASCLPLAGRMPAVPGIDYGFVSGFVVGGVVEVVGAAGAGVVSVGFDSMAPFL